MTSCRYHLHRGHRKIIFDCIRPTCEDDSLLRDPEGCLLLGEDKGPLLSGDPEAEPA